MKKVTKSTIPNVLKNYSPSKKCYSWKKFRKNRRRYLKIKNAIFKDQGGICAYCEQDFSSQKDDDDYITQMIEHFHPKRDLSSTKDWALDWNNLLGCCTGGTEANKAVFATPNNLSCDKYKEIKLPINDVEGEIINPIDMPAFPCLFGIDELTGELLSDSHSCQSFTFSDNKKGNTKALVDNTIVVLNLNCNRLLRKRKTHIDNFQKLIEKLDRTMILKFSKNYVIDF